MKRFFAYIFAFIAILMFSTQSAWADKAYVKVTAEDGTVSWVEIIGIIDGTNIEIYNLIRSYYQHEYHFNYYNTIDISTIGVINLNEVWSQSGGSGIQYQVISIGQSAFYNCSGLTSIIIPSSVTSIGTNAFYGCNFKSVIFEDGNETLSLNDSFTCETLYLGRNISDSSSKSPFNGTSLTSLTIGNEVTHISSYLFKGCNNLTSITIGNNVTNIEEGAFSGCSSLTSIKIPSSVTVIGNSAFSSCYSLSSIDIPSSVTYIGNSAFSGCSNLTSIDIPFSVTYINNSSFSGCSNLTSITIGNNVIKIGESAFSECSSLTSFTIPNCVTSIGKHAFSGCNLTSIEIPSSVTNIGDDAFTDCLNLTSVTIEDGSETLHFEQNNIFGSIETLYLGRIISYIGSNPPFAGKTSLTSLTIGNNVTSIEGNMFKGCSNLKSVIISDNVTSIGSYAFHGCSGLTSLTIGNNVVSIRNYAFQGCSGLTSVIFPNRLNIIGDYAFANCSGITSIDIPTRVNTIGQYAFSDCSGLTTLSIPNSITSIGISAFSGCTNLESVYSEITTPFEIDAFINGNNATLYVPYGTKLSYIQTSGWNVFKDIVEMDPAIMNTSLLLSCNSKGSITINGTTVFTNKIGGVDILEDAENTIVFTPKANCKLEQVCFNGFDVTTSVENNTLKAVIPAKSQMVVTFANEAGDMNTDGKIDISDVVVLVNMILGQ